MPPSEGRTEALIMFCAPALIVAVGCGLSLLPSGALATALDLLIAWACLSVPLSLLFGHCVLSEE